MADQMQSDKDKNRQDTGKPVQLDKEQQQQDKDKKPMGGQENRPSHQQGGADHQSGSKR